MASISISFLGLPDPIEAVEAQEPQAELLQGSRATTSTTRADGRNTRKRQTQNGRMAATEAARWLGKYVLYVGDPAVDKLKLKLPSLSSLMSDVHVKCEVTADASCFAHCRNLNGNLRVYESDRTRFLSH